jgi:membrane protease YdiL (CAAX protease family)
MAQTGYALVDGTAAANRPPAPPRTWLFCLCTMIVAQWPLGMSSGALQGLWIESVGLSAAGSAPPLATFAFLALPFLVLALLALLASRHFDRRGLAAVGLRPEAWAGALPWLLVGMIVAGPTWARLFQASPGWIADTSDALAVLAPATLIQAGGEEVLFRGILLPCLIARYGGGRGLLISAALFGLWHIYPGQPLADVIVRGGSTFIAGLTLGIVALRQGHLGGAIALHLVWNIADALRLGFDGVDGDILGSYISSLYDTWTFADLSGSQLQTLLLPLALETICVLTLCRETVLQLFGDRKPAAES